MFSKFQLILQSVVAVFLFPLTVLNELLRETSSSIHSQESEADEWLEDVSERVTIVTGSNTGIGKETAIALCSLGATVVLACRDKARGEEAEAEVLAAAAKRVLGTSTKLGTVKFIPLDLNDLRSVLAFVKEFERSFPRLDILVNNAGLNIRGTSTQGLQQLFQVNYLGHYLLTRLLMKRCERQNFQYGNLRIVNLSSVMHHTGNPDFRTSAYSQYLDAWTSTKYSYYDDSKLYMNLFTMEINSRYAHYRTPPVVAVSANPGAVRSDIWRHVPMVLKLGFDLVMRVFFLSPRQGAASSVVAARISWDGLTHFLEQSIPALAHKTLSTTTYTNSTSSLGGLNGARRKKKTKMVSSPIRRGAGNSDSIREEEVDSEEEDVSRDAQPVTPASNGSVGHQAGLNSSEGFLGGVRSLLFVPRKPKLTHVNDSLGSSGIFYRNSDMKRLVGEQIYHPWVPYFSPYRMHWRLLAFELLGAYAGANWTPVTLPVGAPRVATELWEFSAELCTMKLAEAGTPINLEI